MQFMCLSCLLPTDFIYNTCNFCIDDVQTIAGIKLKNFKRSALLFACLNFSYSKAICAMTLLFQQPALIFVSPGSPCFFIGNHISSCICFNYFAVGFMNHLYWALFYVRIMLPLIFKSINHFWLHLLIFSFIPFYR